MHPDHYVATPDGLTIAQPPAGTCYLQIETLRRSVGQHQADGPLSLERHLLHAMRGGRLPPHHLFPRPARRDGGLHDAHRGARRAKPPILLSNGNLVERGDVPGTSRHFAVWHDPVPKPSYLFALVGGNLGCVEDSFVTHVGPQRRAAHLCRARQGGPLRLGDGFAQALDALGRGGLRPRIRSRHLHDRRGLRLQHGGDGEQGPQHLQRQIRARRRPRPRPTPTSSASRRSSRTSISTTGPATASPAATGSSSASRKG